MDTDLLLGPWTELERNLWQDMLLEDAACAPWPTGTYRTRDLALSPDGRG